MPLIKDSKDLVESLKEQSVAQYESIGSFDTSAFFTSIPVPAVLEVSNRKFTEHIEERGLGHFLKKVLIIPIENVISLFELVLNNYPFY